MSDGIEIGDDAPAFELPDTDDKRHAVPGDRAAEATVVYWTCNHCPYALAWHDRLLVVASEYEGRGVRVLAINSNDAERYPADSPQAMRERVEREGGWPNPYLRDESQEVARAYGAQKTPDMFVFDADLKLRYRGAPDADYDDPGQAALWLREALDAVLDGREPDRPQTDPVGCGVKWKEGMTGR